LYFTLLYFTQPYSLKGNRQHITTTLFFSVWKLISNNWLLCVSCFF
jgi:hypothetical protein